MNLLDIDLPPFVRINYVSKSVKEEWEPKIKNAQEAYNTLERLSVSSGIRDATTLHVDPNNLDKIQSSLLREGLIFVPIRKVGSYSGFSHYHVPQKDGRPWNYYGLVVRDTASAKKWLDSESNEGGIDHKLIGRLLGYPECCIDSFYKNWVVDHYYDPMWQMANATSDDYVKIKEDTFIKLSSNISWLSNVLLRYIGVRVVPHIPCSMDCENTKSIAESWIDLGRNNGIDGINELEEILSMNISWDALKGIAIISTPIMKVVTNSVPCYPNYVIHKEGDFYPPNSPNGVKFPWKIPNKVNKINELRKLQAEGKISAFK